jgi:YbbR domain-containing protein
MHGMLSAAILIGVLAVVAAACLYLAVRVYAVSRR